MVRLPQKPGCEQQSKAEPAASSDGSRQKDRCEAASPALSSLVLCALHVPCPALPRCKPA